jgi:hypothetical protein
VASGLAKKLEESASTATPAPKLAGFIVILVKLTYLGAGSIIGHKFFTFIG